MNYLKQINLFHKSLLVNPINANSQCLYYTLLYINNCCNWKKDFTVANSTLMAFTGLNKQQLYRARNNLLQNGFIYFEKGKNQTEAGHYIIVNLMSDTATDTATNTATNTATDTATDTAINTATDTATDTATNTATDTYNKHKHKLNINKTKLNNIKESKKVKTLSIKNPNKDIPLVDKEKKENLKTFNAIIDSYTENVELRDALKAHLRTRKLTKGALTNRAIELELQTLDRLTEKEAVNDQENKKIEIVNQSIERGWTGFFEVKKPKEKEKYNSINQKGSFDDFKELMEEAIKQEQKEAVN